MRVAGTQPVFVNRSSRRTVVGGMLALAFSLLLSIVAPAQRPTAQPPPPPQDAPPATDASSAALPARQRELQQRLARLESQMLKLAKLLAESEPAKAQRLREALRVHGEKELIRRLQETARQLQEGQLGDADASQQALIRDLNEVLKEISDEADAVDEKRAERERVLELRRQVEQLRSGQLENLQRTRAALRAAEFADRLSREAEALRAALEKAAAQPETGKPENVDGAAEQPPAPSAAELAKQLQAAAREAEGRLRDAKAAAPDERAGRAVDEAREELKGAAESSSESGKSEPQPGGQPSESSPAQSGQAESSEPQSGQTGKPQNGGATSAPSNSPDKTKEKIERAIRRLNDEARRLRQAEKSRELERAERALEADARAAQDAQESQDKQHGGKAGAQRLQKAREKMQKAADELSEQDTQASEEEQREALDELQQTLEELEDALRQTRQDEMEETLGALESKLRALLARADRTREQLAPLAKMSPSALEEREAARAIIAIADELAGLQSDTRDVRRLLVDEGTTVLMPELLEQVNIDFAAGERALRDRSPPNGLSRLDAAIAALKEVLEAVAQRRDEMREQQHEGQQGGGGSRAIQALLPGSTELKLLRSAQARVHAETAEIAGQTDSTGTIYSALADRQAKLIDLARKMQAQ